jgi:arylsulfatase A
MKGKIEPDRETAHISAFWDVLPTVAEITGSQIPENIDGISFLPTLLGESKQNQHNFLYWEFYEHGGRRAVRKGDWKLINYNLVDPSKTTTELYNLAGDPGEENNLADKNQQLVNDLEALMDSAHIDSEIFTFK